MESTSSPNVQDNKLNIKNDHVINVLVCALTIPLSMSMWIINIIYSKIMANEGFDEPMVISPSRWLITFLLPVFVIAYGYKKKSINLSGAILGYFIGFAMTLSNYCFMTSLLAFFFSSSRATKYRDHMKRKFEENFKEGGQRNWVQALCNAGMATQLSLLYLLDVGSTERPIDFVKDYRASWLQMGVLGVFACCNGDTWASELGSVLSKSKPYSVTTWKQVPTGTNGGITPVGTLMSTLGGLFIGFSYFISVLCFSDQTVLLYAPSQLPLLFYGALAGFLGSLIDSFLGATLQYSGLDKDGKIVSHSSKAVKHISGNSILDNESVNLISTVIMGLLLPTISKYAWPLA